SCVPRAGRDARVATRQARRRSRCYPRAHEGRPMRRNVLTLVMLLVAPAAPSQVVPAEFLRDRIFAVVSTPHGAPVRFLTDSGGGWNAISESAQARLNLRQDGAVDTDAGRAPLVDASALFSRS